MEKDLPLLKKKKLNNHNPDLMELTGVQWRDHIKIIDQLRDEEKYIFAFDVIQGFKENECYQAHDFCLRRACFNGSESPVAHLCSEDLLYLQKHGNEYPLFDYVIDKSLSKQLQLQRSKSANPIERRKNDLKCSK